MDYEAKFTEVKQARYVKPKSHVPESTHNSEHVDLVISGKGRPQESRIFGLKKFIEKLLFIEIETFFANVHSMKYRIR